MSEEREKECLALEKKLVEHDFPPQLFAENTSYCNLKCIHCSHKEMTRPNQHMKRELWNKIVEEVGQESPATELWPSFYGEPLILGKELWDRLDYAAKVGCNNLVLNSNGVLIERHYDAILNSPVKRFIISLDALTKESFEKVRVRAKWEKIYPAVEELLRRRQEGQAKVIVQFTVLPENADECPEFEKYWHEKGAEVRIFPMIEWTKSNSVSSETIVHNGDFRIACYWSNNTMGIHQDGSVVTCSVDFNGKFRVGNIENMSVKEGWIELQRVREAHRRHDWEALPDICKGCGDWQVLGINTK